MSKIILNAEPRSALGKGASRRVRRENKIPAIIYGTGQEAVPLTLDHSAVIQAQEKEVFYSQVLALNICGQVTDVLVKNLQRDPFKPKITHIDFLRISASESVTTMVPVHFINGGISSAVKNGGIIHHHVTELEISCLPKYLPEFLSIDVIDLENGGSIHLSEIALPEGITSVQLGRGNDLVMASAGQEYIGAAEIEKSADETDK